MWGPLHPHIPQKIVIRQNYSNHDGNRRKSALFENREVYFTFHIGQIKTVDCHHLGLPREQWLEELVWKLVERARFTFGRIWILTFLFLHLIDPFF